MEKKIKSARDLASQIDIPWAIQEDDNFHIYTSELHPSDKETTHLITIAEQAAKLRLDAEWYGACYTTETKKDNKGGNSIVHDRFYLVGVKKALRPKKAAPAHRPHLTIKTAPPMIVGQRPSSPEDYKGAEPPYQVNVSPGG